MKIGEMYNGLTIIDNGTRSTPSGGKCWICKCNCCGNIVEFGENRIYHKNGCGYCNISWQVREIRDMLISNNIPFIMEKVFNDLQIGPSYLRFDFYVNNKYIIEYDDKSHFNIKSEQDKKHRKYDLIKNKYCFEHHIPIIRIPYTMGGACHYQDINIDTSQFVLTPVTEQQYYNYYGLNN